MASADLVFSWKEHFRDSWSNKSGWRLCNLPHNQSRQLEWIDNWENTPRILKGMNSESLQDGNLRVSSTTHSSEAAVSREDLDRPALFSIIKSCIHQKDLLTGSRLHADVLKGDLLSNDVVLGNALVSMYAKLGMLSKAHEFCDQLSVRNVVTWNALIAAYAHHGLGDEALSCYDRMQEEGLSPNAVTFVSCLKACGCVGSVEKGEQIHAEISRLGLLESQIMLGTALVDMYAKCSLLAKAQGLFEKLPLRNTITWNVLLAGYAQHACDDDVISLFELMKGKGFSPDAVTFMCVLKACGNIEAFQKGEELHEEINRQGLLEKNIALGNSLVDMYAKCGKLTKAKAVFDQLPTRDVISWNSLLDGYVRAGQGDEVLSCYSQMQADGHSPDAVTFLCVLKACGSKGAVKKGEEIHKEVETQGLLQKNIALGNALVDMYAKCGLLAKAQAVFDKLPAWDKVSWNVLINGYADHGLGNEALGCFSRMRDGGLSPDAITFVSVLKSCGSIGAIDQGEEIHDEINRHGLLENDVVLGNALVDMYAKCGALEKAQRAFDKLPRRNLVSWNVLINGFVHHKLNHKALSCFRRMQEEGIFPNTVTFLSILKACGSLRAIKEGEEIHTEVNRQGLLERSVVLGNALVDMYAKCGAMAKAQGVFDKLPARNTVSWNTLITGYALHDFNDEAIFRFEQMQGVGVVPDSVTFASIFKACASLGAFEKGEEMQAMVNQMRLLEQNSMLGTALVDMYAKCGALAKAQRVFEKLPARDVVAWNALMSGYAQIGEVEMVFISFTKMTEERIEPDLVTFIVLLTACSHAGLVEKGEMCFHVMTTVYRIIPTLKHCTCMVDILSRAGQFHKAASMIKGMPPLDCLLLWSFFMGACQNWEFLELGRWAFENAVQLDDNSAAAYVCIRNLYAGSESAQYIAGHDEDQIPLVCKYTPCTP